MRTPVNFTVQFGIRVMQYIISVMGQPTRQSRAALEALPVARLCIGEPLVNGASFAGGESDGLSTPRVGTGPRMMLRTQVVVESQGGPSRIAWFPYTDDEDA